MKWQTQYSFLIQSVELCNPADCLIHINGTWLSWYPNSRHFFAFKIILLGGIEILTKTGIKILTESTFIHCCKTYDFPKVIVMA
jgi:hypothetical protein